MGGVTVGNGWPLGLKIGGIIMSEAIRAVSTSYSDIGEGIMAIL